MDDSHAVVKLDFSNAFNSVRRDRIKEAVESLAPNIYPFVYSSYLAPSILQWESQQTLSLEGVQQGDPLGPLLFFLALHKHCQRLSSELHILYLDDVTIGGSCQSILNDSPVMMEAADLGLNLNRAKSAVITCNSTTLTTILSSLPWAQAITHAHATLGHLLAMPQASHHLFWRKFQHWKE